MADYLIMYGAPWLLQAENTKTKRALEQSTADKTKIYHLSVNFLRWWGRAMHVLSNYSNSPEVRCARIASSGPKSERDKENLKKAKELQRALKSGCLQYHELSDSQEKLLPLALRPAQENRASNPRFDTIPQATVLCNYPTPWTVAVTSTCSCEEAATTTECQTAVPTPWSTESKCCDRRESDNDQAMPTLCLPPGLSLQSSAERSLPVALSSRSPQEFTTQR